MSYKNLRLKFKRICWVHATINLQSLILQSPIPHVPQTLPTRSHPCRGRDDSRSHQQHTQPRDDQGTRHLRHARRHSCLASLSLFSHSSRHRLILRPSSHPRLSTHAVYPHRIDSLCAGRCRLPAGRVPDGRKLHARSARGHPRVRRVGHGLQLLRGFVSFARLRTLPRKFTRQDHRGHVLHDDHFHHLHCDWTLPHGGPVHARGIGARLWDCRRFCPDFGPARACQT